MDTFLAIASKRDERRYAERPIPAEVVERILDAGRLSGNSQNKQAWRFVASCPNGIRDAAAAEALELEEGELAIVLSLGYPARPRDAEARRAEEWSEAAKRKSLRELVTRL